MTALTIADPLPREPGRFERLEAKVAWLDRKVTILIVLCLPETVKHLWGWLGPLLGG